METTDDEGDDKNTIEGHSIKRIHQLLIKLDGCIKQSLLLLVGYSLCYYVTIPCPW